VLEELRHLRGGDSGSYDRLMPASKYEGTREKLDAIYEGLCQKMPDLPEGNTACADIDEVTASTRMVTSRVLTGSDPCPTHCSAGGALDIHPTCGVRCPAACESTHACTRPEKPGRCGVLMCVLSQAAEHPPAAPPTAEAVPDLGGSRARLCLGNDSELSVDDLEPEVADEHDMSDGHGSEAEAADSDCESDPDARPRADCEPDLLAAVRRLGLEFYGQKQPTLKAVEEKWKTPQVRLPCCDGVAVRPR